MEIGGPGVSCDGGSVSSTGRKGASGGGIASAPCGVLEKPALQVGKDLAKPPVGAKIGAFSVIFSIIFLIKTERTAAARRVLKRFITENPVTGSLYKWRFERHFRGILAEHRSPCQVQPSKMLDTYAVRKGDRVIIVNLKDAVLGGMIADRFDILFSATIPAEEDGLKVVDYSRPKVHTLRNGLQFEFPSLPEAVAALDSQIGWYKPTQGDIIFDCGANVGVSCYHFSKMVGPTGRVISFEPDRISLGYLRKNIARHGLENVTVVEAAIGGADGKASFFSEGTVSSGMAHVLRRKSAGDVIEVPVISLRTAFSRYGTPNLCKIDIEGAEIEALESAAECFSSLEINFVVDTDHLVDDDTSTRRVEAIFRRAGYETETVGETLAVTYARPSAKPSVLETGKRFPWSREQ